MAITKRVIEACARNVLETCNLKKGDGILIRGGAHALEFLESIALECYRSGATPTIMVTSDKYTSRVFKEIPASTLETVPKEFVGAMKACDMIISVEDLDNPLIAADFPLDKIRAMQKARLPMHELLSHPTKGKKWAYVGWPTKAAARSHGISYSELEKTIIGGMTISPSVLMRIGKRLDRRFKNASWVHVWDSKGTDFRVKIEGRSHNIDDGIISKADFDAGDRGANLPAGELFFAPHETVGEGTLFCPVTRERHTDKLVTDILLEFKKGKLLLDKVITSKNRDVLVSAFKDAEKLDKTKFDPVRTTNLGELGIGFNPKVKRPFGYILTDEKVTGTVHVAFGLDKPFGGKSDSTMHWDFVSAPGVNIEVERTDGRIVQVMAKGKIV